MTEEILGVKGKQVSPVRSIGCKLDLLISQWAGHVLIEYIIWLIMCTITPICADLVGLIKQYTDLNDDVIANVPLNPLIC